MKRFHFVWLPVLMVAAGLFAPQQVLAQKTDAEKAYPFELKDTLGRIIKFEDFKGKALVMDFWFTGCKGCIQIAEMLHKSIMPVFEQDTNVVFISVSVDINFLQWKRSLRTGLYTSNKQVNLFTMGMGTTHPLFRHYHFSGCPQMLVVDKAGNVISKTVPPDDKTIIELIKQAKT